MRQLESDVVNGVNKADGFAKQVAPHWEQFGQTVNGDKWLFVRNV